MIYLAVYSPDEWIQTPDLWLKLIHPDDVEHVLAELKKSHAEGIPFSADYRLKTKQDEWRHFHDYARVVYDSDDNPLYLQGMMLDITERKQGEDRLRYSESKLRTIFTTINNLIWLKDIDGVYLACNPMFERFFGARESDIIGKTDYNFVDVELADFFRENDRVAMSNGGGFE